MSSLVEQSLEQHAARMYPARAPSTMPEPALSPAAAALVRHGAPLLGHGESAASLEDSVAGGVTLARREPAALRALVVVILKNKDRIRWAEVRKRLPPEDHRALGAAIDVAAAAIRDAALQRVADRLFRELGALPDPEPFCTKPTVVRYEVLMGERSPLAMRRWGFLSSTPLDDYEEAARRFCR